jgi:formylglycine-generating enzyme required for sulfatase activity
MSEDLSIYFISGLGGNVREWCRDGWTEKPVETVAEGAWNPLMNVQWDTRHVVKGGCYFSDEPEEFHVYGRRGFEPENTGKNLGFRIVFENL